MRNLAVILTLSMALSAFADEKQTPQEYIEKYKDYAIIEMYRSGVPASITLCQGILESNSGNSRLAVYANNHFGIKCKGDWTGNVIYADDDAPDECFRAYPSVLASFQDHSDFLRANWRYHDLFELARTDYVGWCKGLRKAGYATNPKYDVILINLIERYELHSFDLAPPPGGPLEPMAVQTVNNVPMIYAAQGQTVSSIAMENDLKDKHIRKWNDLPPGAEIETGDAVYLKPKRRRAEIESHTVVEGETMHSISQTYGIKLKHLYKKNYMTNGQEPQAGEVIYMQKRRPQEDSVHLKAKAIAWEEEQEKFVNPHSIAQESQPTPAPILKDTTPLPDYHVVEKGDNIYRIAEKYHVFEEDLMRWNKDLNPASLKIGQKIYLSEEASIKNGAAEDKIIAQPEPPVEKLTDEQVEQESQKITVNGPVYHHVAKGDTVYSICKRYGITQEQLKEWNEMETVTIYIGQTLKVSE